MLVRPMCLMLAAVASLAACAGSVAPDEAAASAVLPTALKVSNGTNLNGTNLNGTNLNGKDLNGKDLNGKDLNGGKLNQTLIAVSYAGATLEGAEGGAFDRVWLQGSEFRGVKGGKSFHGADFTRAQFIGTLGNGETLDLRVDSLTPPAMGDDVWQYQVSYWDTGDRTWRPICVNGDGTASSAIAVAGRWDYRQGVPGGGDKIDDPSAFTFACQGGTIAKCILIGYKPWSSVNGQELADFHQTCTRLLRADYCGDGHSYTMNGQWVNVYDVMGIQHDTENWSLEARWDPSGALCLSSYGRAGSMVTCASGKLLAPCGLGLLELGTLLVSETP